MKIEKITYLVDPTDLIYDQLDVFVFLEDEYCSDAFAYVIEVTTLEFLSEIMKKSKSSFLPPSYPYIIVSKLTDQIIHSAVQAFVDEEDDSFWLKLYHTIVTLDTQDLNKILYQKNQENIALNAEIDAEE